MYAQGSCMQTAEVESLEDRQIEEMNKEKIITL